MNTRTLIACCVVALAFVGCGPKPPVPLAVAKIAVTQPGKALGPMAQASIPTTGGKVVSADGRVTIDVPSGALAASKMITIQSITNETPGGAGLAYRLGPEGQTFTAPVKLTFKYAKADINGSAPASLKIAYQDKEGRWNAIKQAVLDEAAKTVTVETTHFSDWSMLRGWQLRPPTAKVGAGKSVDLEVVACATKGTGDDELAELIYTCVPDPEFFTVEDWAVNGINGGSLANGQVASSQQGTARYTAPNSRPPANPVNVSAYAKEKSGKKTLLISAVWVEDKPPLTGIITSTQVDIARPGDVITTTASVTFKYDAAEDAYKVTAGTVNSTHDIIASNCEQRLTFAGAIAAADGTILLNEDATYFAQGRTLGTYTGTTTCNSSGKVEPHTIYDGAYWWPAPMSSTLSAKEDGRLEELLVDFKAMGKNITVQWSLIPET